MRIVNIMPHPRHVSYASSSAGGRTLKPSEIGPEIDLEHIHMPLLQKDLAEGKIQIRLSVADKIFIEKMLSADEQPLKKVKQKVRQKPKPKPKPKKAPKPTMTPDVVPQAKTTVKPIKDIKPDDVKKGGFSLADLQAQNTPGMPQFNDKKSTPDDIAKHTGGLV